METTTLASEEPQMNAPLRMTYEEFLEWADEDTRAEWVDGEVIMYTAPVGGRHQKLIHFLLHLLDAYLAERPVGEVYSGPYPVKLGPDLPGREPDIIFVAAEHMDRYKETHLDGPPDIAVEIISPGSIAVDRGSKFYEYETASVREYWLIDPLRKEADFYRLSDEGHYGRVQLDETGYFRSEVLPEFRLDPGWLWRKPLPTFFEVAEMVGEMLASKEQDV
ncbi:MAG: Uma2 family endonuclease [Anaerolineae bacterium]|nr:Uma2 family endonuclease [Anaerolineae bacterium]